MSRSAGSARLPKIAILGTRGIPANYGGFETFAEELSTRLARRGHDVTVYGRSHFIESDLRFYRGVNIRVLPSVKHKYLETVTHTALAVFCALFRRYDVLFICNAANAFLCWIPKLVGQKVVLNVDGIDRLRKKWNRTGRAFYRFSEFLATVFPDLVVTDARRIQHYYWEEYGFQTRFIPYGASAEMLESQAILDELGLKSRHYLLYVSRLEPENNADLVIQAFLRSQVKEPLVIVGDAPYAQGYIRELDRLAAGQNVLLPGAIYGQEYRELLSHSLCCIHATEVGGTHPALLEAMGCACIMLVNDTPENREVVGQTGLFYPFNNLEALAQLMNEVSSRPDDYEGLRQEAQQRVREAYDWEHVVCQYEGLLDELNGFDSGIS